MKRPALLAALMILVIARTPLFADDNAPLGPGEMKIDLVFTGGHDTDPRDRGRSVILVASALNVPPQVFRDAFSHVHPAGPGQSPQPDQVRDNKRALLDKLGPYGVTNDRLDEVSNYYRYRPQNGEMWRHVDAAGYAIVKDNKLVSVVLTEHGAGYSSAPKVSIPGVGLTVYPTVIVSYGTDLTTNGSILRIASSPLGDGGDPVLQSHSGIESVPSLPEGFSPGSSPPPPLPPPPADHP